MGNGDVESAQAQSAQSSQGLGNTFRGDGERHVDPVEVQGLEGSVVHGRGETVLHRPTDDADYLGLTVQSHGPPGQSAQVKAGKG